MSNFAAPTRPLTAYPATAIGEIQRGLLLSAWGWWTVGAVTRSTGIALLVGGVLAVANAATIRFWRPRRTAAISCRSQTTSGDYFTTCIHAGRCAVNAVDCW